MGRVEQALLEILKENGGKEYQAALVSKSGFSRSRVSEVLSKMEKEGLVSRSPLGIGKNVNVMLNFKGEWSKDSRSGGSRRKIKRWIRLGFTNAAEYPYVVEFKRLLKDRLDLNADLRIYANGIEVMRDLSLFRLDLGISPILTEFMFYSIGAPIKIIAPAGSGGSSLVVSKENYRMRGSRRSRRKRRRRSWSFDRCDQTLHNGALDEILCQENTAPQAEQSRLLFESKRDDPRRFISASSRSVHVGALCEHLAHKEIR